MVHTPKGARWNCYDIRFDTGGFAQVEDVFNEDARHEADVDVVRCRTLLFTVQCRIPVRHGAERSVLNEEIIQLKWHNVLHLEIDDSVKVTRVTEREIEVES
jgi:hypothetical protein